MALKFTGGKAAPAGPDFQLAQNLANDIMKALITAKKLKQADRNSKGGENPDLYRPLNFLQEAENSLADYMMGS